MQWHDQQEFVDGLKCLFDKRGTNLNGLIDRIDSETTEFAPLLQLPAPTKSIRQWFS